MALTQDACPFQLIVGLGNPGKQYADTRHNVGFVILDRLAQEFDCCFSLESKWDAYVARKEGMTLMKPVTYMNLSGKAVRAVAHYFKISPQEILVIYDDASLSLGQLRLRLRGSAGGHNGIQSLIDSLGREEFPRLKVGIGQTNLALKDHVLGKFLKEEKTIVEKTIDRATEAVQYAQLHGLEAAMTKYNQKIQSEI